jgi:hypothetical protein
LRKRRLAVAGWIYTLILNDDSQRASQVSGRVRVLPWRS